MAEATGIFRVACVTSKHLLYQPLVLKARENEELAKIMFRESGNDIHEADDIRMWFISYEVRADGLHLAAWCAAEIAEDTSSDLADDYYMKCTNHYHFHNYRHDDAVFPAAVALRQRYLRLMGMPARAYVFEGAEKALAACGWYTEMEEYEPGIYPDHMWRIWHWKPTITAIS